MPSRARNPQKPPNRAKFTIEAPERSKPNYYGAMIRYAKPGPRRELILRIETWPKGKATLGGGDVVAFRFGAIVNYEEVRRFFVKVPKEGLHYLRELDESNPRRHVIEIEFDRTDDHIRIIAGKVSRLAPED